MIQSTRKLARLGASIAILGGALSATFHANAQQGNRPEVPPGLELGESSRGEEAIRRLGKYLPAVAAAYDMESPALQALIRRDRDLWVDREGHLLYVCEGLTIEGDADVEAAIDDDATEDATTAESEIESSSAVPSSTDAFKLHSLPGGARKIYLDFTGHTTSGTSWNSNYTSGKSIVSAPFDMDGSPTTFSSTERDRIKKIWQRVAEDFAPFAVDVTTEDAGLEALRRTSSTDNNYGIRVVISPSSGWYPNAGGVAYIGSFKSGSDTPCFVFSNMLGPNGEKYVAEAASHEVGHTLGLNHDGKTDGTTYYAGHGSWAPIMGSGYNKAITQFSKGEYSGANNKQDDTAVMTTYGASFAADDHGNSTSTATALSGTSITELGVLETRADVDVFRLTAGAGLATFKVVGTSPQPNANLKLELLNSSGSVVVSSNLVGLDALISLTLNGGTYYLRVSGVGAGDPYSTGYSDYDSLGEYLLTATIVSITSLTNSAPVAVASATPTSGTAPLAVAFKSTGSYDPDGSISGYKWTFGDGTTSTAANPSKTYNSVGSYTATLVVTDNGGKVSATKSLTITASSSTSSSNLAPIAKGSATPTSGSAPLTVRFSSWGSYDPDGWLRGYKWNFGDGTSSTAANPSKTYNSTGKFTATLTVTDKLGKVSAPKSFTISVGGTTTTSNNTAPIAKGSASPTSGSAALAVSFSSWGSYDPDGWISSYKWTFGDGTTSTAQNPSKTYKSAGSYTAKLVVTDKYGATGSKSFAISVK